MKLSNEEWELLIKKKLAEKKFQKEHPPEKNQRMEIDAILEKLRKYIPIPIIIGAAALLLFYHYFGGQLLFRKILEWTIAGTLFATILATLGRQKRN